MRKHIPSIIFILLLAFSYTVRYADFTIPTRLRYATVFAMVIYSFAVAFKRNKEGVKFVFKYFFIPVLLIHLYTLIMVLIGKFDARFLTANLTAYTPVLVAMAIINMYGGKSIRAACIALSVSWATSVFASTLIKGIGVFPFAIQQGYLDEYTPIFGVSDNYLELHDTVMSFGIFMLYYLLFDGRKTTKNKVLLMVFMLAVFLLGIKRIAIVGIIIAYIVVRVLKNKNELFKKKAILVMGIVGAVVSLVYVYMIMNMDLAGVLLRDVGVNVMGRNYYFEVVSRLGEFSIFYPGIGRNAVSILLQTDYSYLNVGGAHCDILKMFIENGFIIFVLWLWYYLIKLPRVICNKFGSDAGLLYFAIIVYTFILYATDNVENYYAYQSILIIVPVAYAMMPKSDREKRQKIRASAK